MPSNAELTTQVETLTKERDTLQRKVDAKTTELTTAKDRGDQEAAARAAAEKARDEALGELADVKTSLRAYKGSATKARKEVTVLKAEQSPTARPFGALKPAKDDAEALARQNLVDHAFADGPMTIVFSDGKRELRELNPLIVGSDAFLTTPNGRVLDHEPLLEPGNCDRGELPIAGFALLNADGDQVAYHALPEKVVVASGTRVQLPKGTIRF